MSEPFLSPQMCPKCVTKLSYLAANSLASQCSIASVTEEETSRMSIKSQAFIKNYEKKEKKEVKVKMLIQQCLSASLDVTDSHENPSLIEIGRGIIVYVCFLNGCKPELVEQAVNVLLKVKLSESEIGTMVSVLDVGGDILIIPQATLGGKLKGSSIQYHSNTTKDEGLVLYENFVKCLHNSTKRLGNFKIKNGVFGERQILKMETNGPFSHILEL